LRRLPMARFSLSLSLPALSLIRVELLGGHCLGRSQCGCRGRGRGRGKGGSL
jgi:hypothetical protein